MIAKGDVDLVLVLALGFGGLTVISVASTALRSYILLILQNTLSLQMVAKLFRHLVQLPLAYFEKRHIGDVGANVRAETARLDAPGNTYEADTRATGAAGSAPSAASCTKRSISSVGREHP